jgi:hypothetical protein
MRAVLSCRVRELAIASGNKEFEVSNKSGYQSNSTYIVTHYLDRDNTYTDIHTGMYGEDVYICNLDGTKILSLVFIRISNAYT